MPGWATVAVLASPGGLARMASSMPRGQVTEMVLFTNP